MVELIKSKRVKANKLHQCDTCKSNIYPGEMYERQTNLFDGEIYNWKNCDHCKNIVNKMFREHNYEFGVGWQDFKDFIFDYEIEFEKR